MNRIIFSILLTLASLASAVADLTPRYDEKKAAWGLAAPDGKYKIGPQFANITQVSDKGFIADRKGKMCYIDPEGRMTVKPKYDSLKYTPHDYLLALKDQRWGTVDKTGREIIKPKYDSMVLTELNHLCVTEKGLAALIKPDDSRIIVPGRGFTQLRPLCRNILIATDSNGKGLYDEQGLLILPNGNYDSFEIGDNGTIYCHAGSQIGIVDTKSSPAKVSKLYEAIIPCTSDLFMVSSLGRKGFITPTGDEILPPRYDTITPATHPSLGQLYILSADGKKGWTDLKTQTVEPQYTNIRLSPGKYGQVMVCRNGEWSPADIKGRRSFDIEIPAGNNLRIVGNKENGDTIQKALVNANFDIIKECQPYADADEETSLLHSISFTFIPVGKFIIATNLNDNYDKDLLGPDGSTLIEDHVFSDYRYFPEEKAIALLDFGRMEDEENDDYQPHIRIFSDSGKELFACTTQEFLTLSGSTETELPENVQRILDQYSPNIEIDDEPVEEVAIEPVTYPVASIDKVWVSHNVWQNNQKGMQIHVKFQIWNCQYAAGNCVAWFSFNNGQRIEDYDGYYRTTDGQVSVGQQFSPKYTNTIFNDLTLFIPVSQLHLKQGVKHNCMFTVGIFADGEQLAKSDPVYFNVTPSTPKKSPSKKKGIRRY